jgi:hypothetical protein
MERLLDPAISSGPALRSCLTVRRPRFNVFDTLAKWSFALYVDWREQKVSQLRVFSHNHEPVRLPAEASYFKISRSFTTLEKDPFVVPIEPRPLPPKTGRASMMISAMRKSS